MLNRAQRAAAHIVLLLGSYLAVAQAVAATSDEIRRYDVAAVIRRLLPAPNAPVGYLDFKRWVSKIVEVDGNTLGEPYRTNSYTYRGEIPLYAGGRRILSENMRDQYQWTITFSGARAGPGLVRIHSDASTNDATMPGATYLRRAGLTLRPQACEEMGSGNYSRYYLIAAPGKAPALLQISKSTGSGGVWWSYEVYYRWFEEDLPPLDRRTPCTKAD
jgi:hypothetical protein